MDKSAHKGCDRFTPTRVGTMPKKLASVAPLAVHPHARGDNGQFPTSYPPGTGSPPRAWGQSRVAGYASVRQRFTPTRVGTIA